MRIIFLIIVSCLTVNAATTHYLVPGLATGANNGSSWADAWRTWSAAETGAPRDSLVYVGDGTSTENVTWNTAASGTSTIEFRKATASDHGSETGWVSTMGDGQALCVGTWSFSSPYWIINGVWMTGARTTSATCGFVIDFVEGQYAMTVSGTDADNIVLKYIECAGLTTTGNKATFSAATRALTIGRGPDNLTVSHCAMHGGESAIQNGNGNQSDGVDSTNITIEHCTIWNWRSTDAAFHGNIWFMTATSGAVFRYNFVWDYNDEGVFLTWWEGEPSNVSIYGNVMSGQTASGSTVNPRGVELRQFESGTPASNNYDTGVVYNNTFVSLGSGGFANRATEGGFGATTSWVVRNNLGYNAANTIGDATADNNTADASDRFTDRVNMDFTLTAALAGASLASTYNTDLLGETRGDDGTWDRGAFEYVAPSSATPTIYSGSFTLTGATIQ